MLQQWEYSRGHSAKKNGWKDACLFVWDAPRAPGSYAERWQYLTELLKGYNPKHVRPVPFLGVATTRRVLDKTLAQVRATVIPPVFGSSKNIGAHYDGGEGVMVRDPDAPYEYSCEVAKAPGHKKGQTTGLYKWLEEYGNDECRVIGPAPGHANSNSLLVELPNASQFVLGSLSRLGAPASSVPAGAIITFTYRGWDEGLPVSASAQALRSDRTWEDIQQHFIPPPMLKQTLSVLQAQGTAAMPALQAFPTDRSHESLTPELPELPELPEELAFPTPFL